MGINFRKFVFDRKNCKNHELVKISHYTVLQLYKLGVEFNRRGYHEDGQTTCGSIQV